MEPITIVAISLYGLLYGVTLFVYIESKYPNQRTSC